MQKDKDKRSQSSSEIDDPAVLIGTITGTSIVNLNTHDCDIIIDRTSKWGNPFPVGDSNILDVFTGKPYTREGCIAAYRSWIADQTELLNSLDELVGKRLGCHCKPLACHGDVLLEIIENKYDEQAT